MLALDAVKPLRTTSSHGMHQHNTKAQQCLNNTQEHKQCGFWNSPSAASVVNSDLLPLSEPTSSFHTTHSYGKSHDSLRQMMKTNQCRNVRLGFWFHSQSRSLNLRWQIDSLAPICHSARSFNISRLNVQYAGQRFPKPNNHARSHRPADHIHASEPCWPSSTCH